jgi:hypothetical protein
MNLRVTRRINLGGRYRLELTAESFNLFQSRQQRQQEARYWRPWLLECCRTVRGLLEAVQLSGVLSTTYKLHEGDECVFAAANSGGGPAPILRGMAGFLYIPLDLEAVACHN